jgi:hypothetical protein
VSFRRKSGHALFSSLGLVPVYRNAWKAASASMNVPLNVMHYSECESFLMVTETAFLYVMTLVVQLDFWYFEWLCGQIPTSVALCEWKYPILTPMESVYYNLFYAGSDWETLSHHFGLKSHRCADLQNVILSIRHNPETMCGANSIKFGAI